MAGAFKPVAVDADSLFPTRVETRLAATYSTRAGEIRPFMNGKVRGGNIAPKPGGWGWRGLFTEWDWTNWIKPQVDRAKLLGLNAIRLLGAPESVFASVLTGAPAAISQTTYVARWVQLAQYCQDQGMALYPCLVTASDFDDTGLGYQDATITGVAKASATALAKFSNVFAFDVFQEGGPTVALADVLAMMAAIRSVTPNVPLTCSRGSGQWYDGIPGNPQTVPLQSWLATNGADFVDVHAYEAGLTPRDMDFILSLTDKPVLIGEYGVNQAQTTAEQTARYKAYADLHNREGVVGSFLWALADQSTASTDQWGVWSNTGFGPAWPATSTTALSLTSGKRTALTDVLPRFHVQDPPTTVYRFPELLSGIMQHPSTQPWGWLPGNATVASNARGLALTASTSADMSAETAPASAVPVVAGTVYEASVDILTAVTARTVRIEFGWYSNATTYLSGFADVVSATDSVLSPTRLRIVATAPATAVFAKVIVRVIAPVTGEVHYINNASLRRF
jgi:hypothetical protein